jgi:tetratricopeptide (TPR) repeat protein
MVSPPLIDIGRLPVLSPHYVGRDAELSRLEAAWEDPRSHVFVLRAFGGVGKSALITRWLDRLAEAGWRGAKRVLDWSFYSQGTIGQVVSAEPFLDYALRFFGDPDPRAGPAHDRGARLAEFVRREKSLLILDGIEPLQYSTGPLAGRLKDSGLAALLKGLAGANPGLCVVTTRKQISDLDSFPRTAPQYDLDRLSAEAGVELLRLLGVNGREPELRAAVEEVKGHALTLTLLGNYLYRAREGDIRQRLQIDLGEADERQGGHAFRVIAAYAQWLGEGPELAILRLLGLFDRPAEADSLAALRAGPRIPHLTDSLFLKRFWFLSREAISEEIWQLAVSNLRDHGLLAKGSDSLDAHPLVRAYFGEELASSHPKAWRAGHLRLYKYLCEVAPYRPRTLQQMQPLFSAVLHGCQAGLHQEVLNEIYLRRIQRYKQNYCTKELGAIGAELTALAGFFERPWDKPAAALTEEAQAFVLNEAVFRLGALARLREAVEPMKKGLERSIDRKDWRNAAQQADHLSELTLTLGQMMPAITFGGQGVELSDQPGGSPFQRMECRSTLADALHQAGRWEESAKFFREAEKIQTERQPQLPFLYSIRGYQYCDLLLNQATSLSAAEAAGARKALHDILERTALTLKVAERKNWLLESALDHLTLGHAHLNLASLISVGDADERDSELVEAKQHLNEALNGLRRAGQENHLPRGLLIRAALRRIQLDFEGAGKDLREAQEIAEGGSMRLFLCDAHLEWTRLHLQQGDAEAARMPPKRVSSSMTPAMGGESARSPVWKSASKRSLPHWLHRSSRQSNPKKPAGPHRKRPVPRSSSATATQTRSGKSAS